MDLINDLELNDTPKTIEFLKDNQVIFYLKIILLQILVI